MAMGFESPLASLLSLLQCNFLLFLTSLLIITTSPYASRAAIPLCLSNQSSALLQFKSGISELQLGRLSSWKKGTDCCHWEGVTCDRDTGFITGLQIPSVSYVSDNNIDPSLFQLSHLRVLNLQSNGFSGALPKRLVELTHLTHLDLSSCYFSGAVPLEISQLTRLVYLDLSDNDLGLQIENSSFPKFVRGFRGLQHLALDAVDISMRGESVSAVISSSIPGLQVLRLRDCQISGTLDESILQLRSLSHVDLSHNSLSHIPRFFQNFTSLQVLKLVNCDLINFPSSIFRLPKLEILDVSLNHDLVLSLPFEAIPRSSNIQYLDLSYVKLSRDDLVVISNLTRLSHLYLLKCTINGDIPQSWASNRIVEMDLSNNNLKGSIPEGFCSSFNLTILWLQYNLLSGMIPSCLFNISSLHDIDLSQNLLSGMHSSIFNLPSLSNLRLNDNRLTGEITATIVNLPSLTKLWISNNMLTGNFPHSLLNLPTLEILHIENNNFNGSLPGFFNLQSPLKRLYLKKNCFSGVIPSSISTFSVLRAADFSSNCFNGTIDLFMFMSLQRLRLLDLSNNKHLTTLESSNSSISYDGSVGVSMLEQLYLSSCNMKGYPKRFLYKLKYLEVLELSDNGIGGKIPSWLWEIPTLEFLILDDNKIEGFEEVVNRTCLQDSHIQTLSSHNNLINGEIPAFICNLTGLNLLDLSKNSLTSTITDCLGSMNLSILNLANNQLQGQIPGFMVTDFQVINFSDNLLTGKIDKESFKSCRWLEVLDLGNNQLNDTFPSWLGNFEFLRVLVLRYNHLHGPIKLFGSDEAFSFLRIFDISNNQFSGSLPRKLFKSLNAMMERENVSSVYGFPYYQWEFGSRFPRLSADDLERAEIPTRSGNGGAILREIIDMLSLVLTIKGKAMLLPKLMETMAILDLSNNMFTGKIPEEIGMLKNLIILNISNNNLSRMIPKSLVNLQYMEALDLSHNHLSGVIPVELSALSFLEVLNLSYNDLHGSIPKDHQFSTFDESSFEGNPGLCGMQVHRSCSSAIDCGTQVQRPCPSGIDYRGGNQQEGHKVEKEWVYGELGIGFAVGLIMITLPILLFERFSNWYWNLIDRAVEFLMQVLHNKALKHPGHAKH